MTQASRLAKFEDQATHALAAIRKGIAEIRLQQAALRVEQVALRKEIDALGLGIEGVKERDRRATAAVAARQQFRVVNRT